MSEEAAFIAALVADPSDRTTALVFADWLDDRDDPRGPMMRNDTVRAWMAPTYENPLPKLREALEAGKGVMKASKILALIGEPAVPTLIALLKHEKGDVRSRAVKILHMLGAKAKDALPALLVGGYAAGRAARDIVSSLPNDSLVLQALLQHGDENVRKRATEVFSTKPAVKPKKNDLAKELDSPDIDKRIAAVKAIAQLGKKAASGLLCKALTDSSDSVRGNAAYWLYYLASPSMTIAIEPLRQALADKHESVRHYAAWALQKMGPKASAALPELLRAWREGREKDQKNAFDAVCMVGVGMPDVLAVVLPELNSPKLASVVIASLLKWPSLPNSVVPAVVNYIHNPVGENWTYQHVCNGLRVLSRINPWPPELLKECREQLAGEHARTVADVLGNIGEPAAVFLPELTTALLREKSDWGAGVIAKAMARIGSEGITALLQVLGDAPAGNTRISAAVADGLREVGASAISALPAMLKRLREVDEQSGRRILWAISAIGPDAVVAVPELVEMFFDDRHPALSHSLCSTLHAFGPAVFPYVPRFLEALRQPARATSHASVAQLLAELIPHGIPHGADVFAAIRDVLRQAIARDVYEISGERAAYVAYAAIRALAAFGPAAEEAIPELEHAHPIFDGGGYLILTTFGKIGGAAIPHLHTALKDSTWEIRFAALEALDATGDTSAESIAAIRSVETDASRKVRVRAAAMLKKIFGEK